jgi:ribosomal protein L37AE/L43A
MAALIDEHGNVKATCDECGKDLVTSNIYGIFCEDKCGYEESVKAREQVMVMVEGILQRL